LINLTTPAIDLNPTSDLGAYAGDFPMQPRITTKQLVRIEHLPCSAVGPLLNNMRTWLDHNGIQPIEFRTATLDIDDIVFDVEFRHADQAALFRAAFATDIERASSIFPRI